MRFRYGAFNARFVVRVGVAPIQDKPTRYFALPQLDPMAETLASLRNTLAARVTAAVTTALAEAGQTAGTRRWGCEATLTKDKVDDVSFAQAVSSCYRRPCALAGTREKDP
jgi:PleD family two-component response regulator